MMYQPLVKFIHKVAESNLRFEELACISGISEITLYKIAAGKLDIGEDAQNLLAIILDTDVAELFPEKG